MKANIVKTPTINYCEKIKAPYVFIVAVLNNELIWVKDYSLKSKEAIKGDKLIIRNGVRKIKKKKPTIIETHVDTDVIKQSKQIDATQYQTIMLQN